MNGTASADGQPGFVELQLLRHGPPHNQLLSPLTEYLALCGDHPNTTLRIPLEHNALETRLRALRYFDSEQTRVDQLRETARIASELLAKVPGLIAELSSDWAESVPFVHLSIASRASELALFPFELAVAPDGFPGAGQPLCLQKQMPICLTRRSRSVRNEDFPWDRKVKVLMIASDAGGEIPVLQHYALLRKIVEPWVGTMPSDPDEDRKRKVGRVLRLLTQANVDKIERTLCDEVDLTGAPFTHIHVLAHGCDLPDTDRRSGIAFHHPTAADKIDAVDGKRLAETLGCLPDYPATSKRHRGPAVVTLATCSSADQGSVAIPGASLAFELHDSGVPLVVGSQFPLSAEGSIIMTESLYRGFMAGRDPRSTIWETRRALQASLSQSPGSSAVVERSAHDWASLTVYAALPDDLEDVLPKHRRTQKKRRLDVRLDNVYHVYHDLRSKPDDWLATFHEASTRAVNEEQKFQEWTKTDERGDTRARVDNSGIVASAQKQIGLLYLRAAKKIANDDDASEWATAGEDWLRASRFEYLKIFQISRDESWALVQYLALDFALRAVVEDPLWITARELALVEEHSPQVKRRVWALSALLELEFLQWLMADFQGQALASNAQADALAKRIRVLFPEASGEFWSAKRQFDRYVNDFAELALFAKDHPNATSLAERYQDRRKSRKKVARPRRKPRPKSGQQAVAEIDKVLRLFADLS